MSMSSKSSASARAASSYSRPCSASSEYIGSSESTPSGLRISSRSSAINDCQPFIVPMITRCMREADNLPRRSRCHSSVPWTCGEIFAVVMIFGSTTGSGDLSVGVALVVVGAGLSISGSRIIRSVGACLLGLTALGFLRRFASVACFFACLSSLALTCFAAGLVGFFFGLEFRVVVIEAVIQFFELRGGDIREHVAPVEPGELRHVRLHVVGELVGVRRDLLDELLDLGELRHRQL